MSIKVCNRFQAAIIHLIISLIIFSVLIFTLLHFWYPTPFFSATGGWQGLQLVAFIDIVLGPLLTLAVFNAKKSKFELTSDLVIITLIQLSALFWGIYTIHQQRPVVVAFLDKQFYTVTARDIKDANFNLQRLNTYGKSSPTYVYINRPSTGEGLIQFQKSVLDKKISPIFNMDYYSPIDDHLEKILSHSLDIEQIIAKDSSMKADFFSLVPKAKDPILALKKFKFIGLTSRYRNIIIVFDKMGNIIGHASAPYKP